ncbi:MAG: carboxypeptidase-like regulatory domain-containing protein, partial [Candidatus Kapabacteria bacterium]|nr:carboxypeptidase-like regulatory domain-containing protein [Candidatus Kapabacteria bacterium]
MKYCAVVLWSLFILGLPTHLFAQGVTTGSVTGTVIGETPLNGATVKIISTTTGSIYGAICKSKGNYLIKGVRPGTYTLIASFVGYRS